jgi:hypothetical protein
MSGEEALHRHHVWHPHEYMDPRDSQLNFRGQQEFVRVANVGRAAARWGSTREMVLGKFLSLSAKWRRLPISVNSNWYHNWVNQPRCRQPSICWAVYRSTGAPHLILYILSKKSWIYLNYLSYKLKAVYFFICFWFIFHIIIPASFSLQTWTALIP